MDMNNINTTYQETDTDVLKTVTVTGIVFKAHEDKDIAGGFFFL